MLRQIIIVIVNINTRY